MKCKKNITKYIYFFIIALLFLYPFRHVNVGVDLWDGGYNYTNFQYSGLDYMDSMWFFATWLANMIGHLLTMLPFADTMLGMNVYATLFVSAMSVGAFVFCVKKLQIPMPLAALGEFLAISLCWAPVSILYNYLTFGLLLAGIICLYHGLVAEKKEYLIIAGVLLGLNVATRFSNLVEAGLILAVWYYGFVCKKKIFVILQETGFCMLGYAGAFGLFLAVMALRYGLGNYIEGIAQLFAMTEYATDYTADSMLWGMIESYVKSTYWLKRYAVILVAALAICIVLPQKWRKLKQGITVAIMLVGAGWLIQMKYLYRDYATYDSIYDPCIIVFIMAILLSVYQMCSKKYSKEEKLQAVFIPLLILLTSLGGNNAMYYSINNLFFVMPCFLGMLWRFIKREEHILFLPFKGIIIVSFSLLLWQGIFFGQTYVYEEATGGRNMTAVIEDVPVLKGIRTGEEKAAKLSELYQYLQSSTLAERECILYGNIPGITYYMELEPAMNVWSDLRSYDIRRMKMNLAQLDMQDEAARPIIILEGKAANYLFRNGEPEAIWDTMAIDKLLYLGDLIEEYGYRQGFFNGKYAVFF